MQEKASDLGDAVASMTLFVPAVQYVNVLREERFGDARFGGTGCVMKSERPRVLNDGRPLYVVNRAVIGTLVPRELFLHLGGFAEMAALEDFEMWLRCERAGAELVDVPDAIYRVYRHRGGKSRNSDQTLYWSIRKRYEQGAA